MPTIVGSCTGSEPNNVILQAAKEDPQELDAHHGSAS